MASITALFSAALALTSTVNAVPVEKRQTPNCNVAAPVVDPAAPMQLFYVPRTAATDNDGCDILTAINAGPVTYLTIEEPDAPASGDQRYLAPANITNAWTFNLTGGYIETSLPIPLSPTPTNATWSSNNTNLYPDGSAQGGKVGFTTDNEGADGGLEISLVHGGIYLDREKTPSLQNDYAIWNVCGGSDLFSQYLAFNGAANDASCQEVYLVGCNKGNCPTEHVTILPY